MKKEQFDEKLTELFGNGMSAEEALEFMEDVAKDESLMEDFDLEMQLRFANTEEPFLEEMVFMETENEFESAEDHLQRVRAAFEKQEQKEVVLTPLAKTWKAIPGFLKAAAIFIIVLSVGLLVYRPASKPGKPMGDLSAKTPAVGRQEILKDSNTNRDNIIFAAGNLFAELNREKYVSGFEDPVEASPFLYLYNQGRYNDLVNKESDFTTLSSGQPSVENIKKYAAFYKALAFIETKMPVKAQAILDSIISHSNNRQEIYEAALWYAGLVQLQLNNTTKAAEYWSRCAEGRSSYAKKAVKALAKLATLH